MADIKSPAICLRDAARSAMLHAGGRGFMRFLPDGEALLVTDAPARYGNVPRLMAELEAAGFVCLPRKELLYLAPERRLLAAMAQGTLIPVIDWESRLHPAQELAVRLMRMPEAQWTEAGERLAIETLRLLWQPREHVLSGLPALRAMAAERLRNKEMSGMACAGALLAQWCEAEREKER